MNPALLVVFLLLLEQAGADALACPVLPSRASLEAGCRGCRCTP